MLKSLIIIFLLAALVAVSWNMMAPSRQLSGPDGSVTAASPHANTHPAAGMEKVDELIAEHRARLATDPLDVEALNALYKLYDQIAQTDKMLPHTRIAVDTWVAQNNEGQGDIKLLAGVAMAALQYGDQQGAILAMEHYHAAQPDNISVIATLGNLNFALSRLEDSSSAAAKQYATSAVDWYAKYLAVATADSQGQAYWNVMVDQASMQLLLSDANNDSLQHEHAVDQLLQVTISAPENWSGWHNYGMTLGLSGQKEQAIAALQKAMEIAANKMQRWESDKQIAMLEGRELPPPPFDQSDPHAGIDMHGLEFPQADPGSANPHGERGSSAAELGVDG
jgi:tetratricopeptide (TPR) repeat protein